MYSLAESHRFKRPKLFRWLDKHTLKPKLWRLGMERTTLIWLQQRMLASESVVSKVNKLRDLRIMPSLNSAIWFLCYSFMDERPIEETLTLWSTCSIRMYFSYCHSSGSGLSRLSQDKPFTNLGCTKVTTSYIPRSLLCGLPSTTSNTQEKDSNLILHYIQLVCKMSASAQRSFSKTSWMRSWTVFS